MEGDLCGGRADAFRAGGRGGRGADRGAVSSVRGEPAGRLQVAEPVSGGGVCGTGGPVAGAAVPPAGGLDGDRRALSCGPAGAPDLGSGEGPRLARAAAAGGGLAGGEHPRRPVRSRGPDGQAAAPAPRSGGERAVSRLRGGQRRVVHRLQGLVPDRRRQPLRAADAERRPQPLSFALPGGGPHRHRACLAGPRCRLARVRPAARAALRQRPAVRLDRAAGCRASRCW